MLVGDLNTGDREPYCRRLTAHLRDAHREAGWGLGFTFPSQLARYHGRPAFPLVRIDYILHDPAWTARAAWSGELSGSDHRYVVADLLLR